MTSATQNVPFTMKVLEGRMTTAIFATFTISAAVGCYIYLGGNNAWYGAAAGMMFFGISAAIHSAGRLVAEAILSNKDAL